MHLRPRDAEMRLEEPSARSQEQGARLIYSPTLRRAWPRDGPEAAICVQGVDVQCVLQFTLIHAASCALHRRTSRVIHRSKLYSFVVIFSSPPAAMLRSATRRGGRKFENENEKLLRKKKGLEKRPESVWRAAAHEAGCSLNLAVRSSRRRGRGRTGAKATQVPNQNAGRAKRGRSPACPP